MKDAFAEYDWRAMGDNPWNLIAEDWMLVTAGTRESWNTMTASWGGFGHIWNMDVVFAFIRPTRHTFGIMEKAEGFTLSFFGPEYRKALQTCGSISGRDSDKEEASGLHARVFSTAWLESPAPVRPGAGGAGTAGTGRGAATHAVSKGAAGQAGIGDEARVPGRISFEEARLVLSCRKVHAQDLDPKGFIDPRIAGNYALDDWHRMYIGAIEKAWKRDA